jgi:hypothetical protein
MKATRVSFALAPLLLLASGLAANGQQANVAEWQRYELGNRSFSVLLPAKPTELKNSSGDPQNLNGIDILVYLSAVDKVVFASEVGFLKRLPENPYERAAEVLYRTFWDGVREGINQELKRAKIDAVTRLIEERKATLAGYPAAEFDFEGGPVKGRLIVTRVGLRLFAALISGVDRVPAAVQEKFFNSFTVLPVAAGTESKP